MCFFKFFLLLCACLLPFQTFASETWSGFGSGFYITSNGYLATNYHVIEGAKKIAVFDHLDRVSEARIVRVDSNNDLALLKVEESGLTFLPVIGSSNVQKGETVFTVGFPNPSMQGLEAKVTQGIISSLSGVQGSPSVFQISVPIQPGNSGGALIDERGNVVGVVNAKLSAATALQRSGTLPENVNYAIKSNYLLELIATVPAIKARTAPAQRKLALPELIAKAESAVVLIAISTAAPLPVSSPSLEPPKTAQKKPSLVVENPRPQPVLPPSTVSSKDKASPIEPEGPSKRLCSETFSEYGRKDFDSALGKIRPQALQGNEVAQFCLGRMYQFGSGVPQSDTEAVKWYRLAAEQGKALAQYYLGVMYAIGRGVPQSDTEEVKWFRLAAEQGLAMAQYNLGVMYTDGRGVPQSDAEAVKWFRLAAEQGLAMAQYNLGVGYWNGRGVPQSDAEAVKWFRLAAEQGEAMAQRNLGVMYGNGRGVPQSDTEAVKWYRLVAEQGDAMAQYNLGVGYERGRGVPQSDTEAVKWYRLAAEQGWAMAQYNLGVMYANGRGVPQSDTEAVKWYRLAAEQWNARAQRNLGVMYGNGRGVPQSDTEAVKWFRLAAEQGDAMAQYNLGVGYERGRGVPQSDAEAIKWYRLAAKNKNDLEAAWFAQKNLMAIGATLD